MSGAKSPVCVGDNERSNQLLSQIMATDTAGKDPDLDGYVDWIVFDRSWGVFSEDCASLEEAQDLAARTGGGPVFRRQWMRAT